jgi:hypothetical protein
VIELNEAFAAQAIAVMRDLGLPADKTNPNGAASSGIDRRDRLYADREARYEPERISGRHARCDRRRSRHRRDIREVVRTRSQTERPPIHAHDAVPGDAEEVTKVAERHQVPVVGGGFGDSA